MALLWLQMAGTGAATNDFGKSFLDDNSRRQEVTTLPSGLQYKVLRSGGGKGHPAKTTPCSCHYEGRTAQNWPAGIPFDSSYTRDSIFFAPDQLIAGWTEALQLMVEGDQWELYIPSELAYGEAGAPPAIGSGDALVFTLELLKIHGPVVGTGGISDEFSNGLPGASFVDLTDAEIFAIAAGLIVVWAMVMRCVPYRTLDATFQGKSKA
eukprot:CAMPEP_0197666786 /NCGR_PEP_ID=MMETSP1338-20131121/63834_1 /TAXON_ID=43686 ORGANISM="Pelagodinium beii, Strain RCC1491" /NCGR_SAMPLE_ID=MMETSP1338 /ASSEMBLY_ACC=CAM_ASM_000754 /LENGTH=208 /DNA_ID=CAMNT_0043245873 /DNA_START=15 /DNA_END=641 /DNA_ORIENTATION=+